MTIGRRKSLALLAYLSTTNRPHSRDTLATLFWPSTPQQRGRANLRQIISDVNKLLSANQLHVDGEQLALVQGDDLWVDVTRFQACLAQFQNHDHPINTPCVTCLPYLQEAIALYHDDFLSGFTLRGTPEFDDWQFFHTEHLRQDLSFALTHLVEAYTAQAEYDLAIPIARRWLSLGPLDEQANRALIGLYGQVNQQVAALRQYEAYADLLDKEFGLPPEMETVTLYEAIKANRILEPSQYVERLASSEEQNTLDTHPIDHVVHLVQQALKHYETFSVHNNEARRPPATKNPVDNSNGPVGPRFAAAKPANCPARIATIESPE